MVSCFAIASVGAAETYTYEAYKTTTSSSPMKYTITSGSASVVDRSSYNGYNCKQITQGTYSITFSVDNLPAGEYDVSFAHVSQTAQYRGVFDISVNGGAAQTVDFASTGAKRIDVTLDAKAVSNGVDANTVTFTVNPDVLRAQNQMFLYSISFVPTGEVGETVATESTTTTTTTTTTTQTPAPDDAESYSYVIYDNMEKEINPPGTETATAETDNMIIKVVGGLLNKNPNYIPGYNFAQWNDSNDNIALEFGLKNVPAGEYVLTLNTADNNQARGTFDVSANGVTLGEVNCLNTTGKKLTEHALTTTFTANGTDNVTVSITPTTSNKQIFLHSIVLTKVGEYVAPVANPVTTDEAASIRLGALNGIRFYTAFDKDAIDALNVNGEAVEYGTIIAPADIISGEFTHEDDNVDVKYTATEYWAGDEFVGSIVNIKEANIGREFVGRGYVKIGDTYYYSDTTSTRSLKGIATSFKEAGYPGATEDQISLVDGWAAAADYVG